MHAPNAEAEATMDRRAITRMISYFRCRIVQINVVQEEGISTGGKQRAEKSERRRRREQPQTHTQTIFFCFRGDGSAKRFYFST